MYIPFFICDNASNEADAYLSPYEEWDQVIT